MISVVVAVYNVEKYIEKCLLSIVNQDYKDFELLLVNDGSTDGSIDLAKKVLSKTDVSYEIIDKENGGQSSARNAGLKHAKGEYIVFIDADDVISNDFLSQLIKHMKPDVDFVFCNYKYVKEQVSPNDEEVGTIEYTRDELLEVFLRRKIDFLLPTMLFNRRFLIDNNLYLNDNINFSEDQMYIWDTIFYSNKSIYLKKKMYGYYLREKSIMTSSPYKKIVNGYEEYERFIEKLLTKFPEYINIIKYILPRWELGTLYTSAKVLSFDEFKDIYTRMNGRNILNEIIGLKDRNAILLAMVSKVSCVLLYKFCIGLNLYE